MKKLTLGFLRRGYSPTGGAEAYLSRLAAGLQEQGFRTLLLGTGDWPEDAWPGEGLAVLPGKSLSVFAKAALQYKQERKVDFLFSLERVPGCDIFRAGDGVHAAWLDHRVGKKRFFWRRWWSTYCSRHREVLALERRLYNASSTTQVIANSQMVAREITTYFKFPQQQITVIPNGVPIVRPLNETERQAARDHFKMHQEECVFLFVGSGWKRKGLDVALKAVVKANAFLKKQGAVPNIRLWVAGKGPAERYAMPYVHFLGPVKKMELLYGATDIFLLPTRYDPFSNASLEALAAGLPVITTRFNGCAEIMQEGLHGSVLKDPTDADACAAALLLWHERLQAPAIQTTALRQRCAALGAEFSMERNVKATLELILKRLK